jgi:plasmid maintenance system antidote protein VapI
VTLEVILRVKKDITEMYALALQVKPDISMSAWKCMQMFHNLYLIEIQN